MGNLHRIVVSGTAALDLLFSGLTTTPNPLYQRRKIDLCRYHHPNYFARLVPEICHQKKLTISIRILLLYYSS